MIKRTKQKSSWENVLKLLFRIFAGVSIMLWILVIALGGFNAVTNLLYFKAFDINYAIRQHGLDIAGKCTNDQDCIILEVYKNYSEELNYAYAPYMWYESPETVLKMKYSDCKGLAGLYVNTLVNLGVPADIKSSLKYRHAIACAYPNDEYGNPKDYYYIIDLTSKDISRVNRGVDPWMFYGGD
jgi:hypothetical protein